MFSQFSHNVPCISCLFTAEEWHSITQTYCICLRIHMLMDILTVSKFWAIMGNKATETPAWFSCGHLSLLWELYWGMKWQATLCWAFLRNTRLLCIVSLPFYMPCTAGKLCFLHTLSQHLLPAIFLIHGSRGQKVVSHCGFQLESHKWVILLRIFSMLISHFISSLEKSIWIICSFENWVVFTLLNLRNSSLKFWILLDSYQVWHANILLHSVLGSTGFLLLKSNL